MNANEITNAIQRKAVVAAVNIAGSLLTDDQLRLLASALSGKTASEIFAIFSAVLPEQHDRTGILLPYMVQGSLGAFATRAHDIVVHMLAAYWNALNQSKLEAESQRQLGTGAANPGQAIGSAKFLGKWSAQDFYGPAEARHYGDKTSPRLVWTLTGLNPNVLSVGFSGTEELKGNLPDASGAAPGLRAYRDAPVSGGGSLSRANAQADAWLEEGEAP